MTDPAATPADDDRAARLRAGLRDLADLLCYLETVEDLADEMAPVRAALETITT